MVVCHALTGSPDVDALVARPPGIGRTLDPDRDFIICCNVLGSCYGSSGPASPQTRAGDRWGADFPAVTVADVVRAQRRVLDALGVRGIRLVVGGIPGRDAGPRVGAQDARVAEAAVVMRRPPATRPGASPSPKPSGPPSPPIPTGAADTYDPAAPPAAGLAAARHDGHVLLPHTAQPR